MPLKGYLRRGAEHVGSRCHLGGLHTSQITLAADAPRVEREVVYVKTVIAYVGHLGVYV